MCAVPAVDWGAVSSPILCCDADDVHVWQVALDATASQLTGLWSLLSPDERERARQFHLARHSTRYIVSRGVLRRLLAAYLGVGADRLQFRYDAHGKPLLVASAGWHFNISHADDRALIAVTQLGPLGVDIERLRDMPSLEQLARLVCSPQETALFQHLSPSVRSRAFFSLWTRKEAYLKATGEGLARPPRDVTVSFLPEEVPVLHGVRGDALASLKWRLEDVVVPRGYCAALAVAKQMRQICYHQYLDVASPTHLI